ncbi:hypothetical protein [Thermococcus barossii]|nr:hypothetical protein [Thermococcus barossii]
MRRIRLITREEAWKWAERIRREYEAIYGIEFKLESAFIPWIALSRPRRS